LDNVQSKNPINWTGQNLLGKALMDIREQIREERNIALQPPTQPIKPPSRGIKIKRKSENPESAIQRPLSVLTK
jgi:hypothetical protein